MRVPGVGDRVTVPVARVVGVAVGVTVNGVGVPVPVAVGTVGGAVDVGVGSVVVATGVGDATGVVGDGDGVTVGETVSVAVGGAGWATTTAGVAVVVAVAAKGVASAASEGGAVGDGDGKALGDGDGGADVAVGVLVAGASVGDGGEVANRTSGGGLAGTTTTASCGAGRVPPKRTTRMITPARKASAARINRTFGCCDGNRFMRLIAANCVSQRLYRASCSSVNHGRRAAWSQSINEPPFPTR